ncbi:MAG: hypothetical protein ACOY4R_09660 [Pseudomonadota bacterium]
MRIKKTEIEKLWELHHHFEGRKKRAKERLDQRQERGWYFAIVGHAIPVSDYVFLEGTAHLRQVEESPGEVELAGALRDKRLISSVGRYSNITTAELFVNEEGERGLTMGWWLISLLRVRSLSDFLVPMAANYSWSVIGGVDADSCEIAMLEDYPMARKIEESKRLTSEDCDWAEQNLLNFVRLLEMPSFRLAVDALTTHHFQADDRMMVAILWAALDALFGIEAELTFRLSLCVSVALEAPGEARLEVFDRMKKLYRFRGKVVHGQALKADAIRSHTVEVRQIISRLLCRFVEDRQVKTAAILEREILMGMPETIGENGSAVPS